MSSNYTPPNTVISTDPNVVDFQPPTSLTRQWAKAQRKITAFLSMSTKDTSPMAQIDTMEDVAVALLPFFQADVIRQVSFSAEFFNKACSVDNKIGQWSGQLGTNPTLKNTPLPPDVDEFLRLMPVYREQRKDTIRTVSTLDTEIAAKKARGIPPTAPSVSSSAKRDRSISVGPSDVESEDELDDGMDIDDSDKAKFVKPIGPTPSAGKRVVSLHPHLLRYVLTASFFLAALHFKKINPAQSSTSAATVNPAKAEGVTTRAASSSTACTEAQEGMSYSSCLATLDAANTLLAKAGKVSYTDDAVMRMDSALRTHLSQIALRISVEVRKYDSVFLEYERIKTMMEERNLDHQDYPYYERLLRLLTFLMSPPDRAVLRVRTDLEAVGVRLAAEAVVRPPVSTVVPRFFPAILQDNIESPSS
ncbi:hypothetical protein K438DRAFT_1998930 [Mycena galopus ATCC 62051]|nr:hypothetical protein K438DRAFT_1998930 [Mycena galopus ATCC 62051]